MFGLASSPATRGGEGGAAGTGASPLSSWFLLDGPPDFRPAAARARASAVPPATAPASLSGATAGARAGAASAAQGPAPRATLEAWCDWPAVEQRLRARDPALRAELERVEAELRAAEAATAAAAPPASAAPPARDQSPNEGADLLGLGRVRRELRSELDAALGFEQVLLGSLR
jgi:hypothetical protein